MVLFAVASDLLSNDAITGLWRVVAMPAVAQEDAYGASTVALDGLQFANLRPS